MRYTINCKFDDLTPQILFGLIIADEVFKLHGAEMWITSVDDLNHSRYSLHYSGKAADIRTRNIPPEHRQAIPNMLRSRLYPGFDVVDEGDHIHIEWDPQ